MTRISDIRSPFNRVLARIQQEITDPKPNMDAINELARIGKKAINAAQRTKAPLNMTWNQFEGFAYGVFFNGQCYRSSLASDRTDHGENRRGSDKDPRRGKYGWSEALHAIRGHHPTQRGYELYITNAMWYSMYHERWKLPVISQEVENAVPEIEEKFGVEVHVEFFSYPVKG